MANTIKALTDKLYEEGLQKGKAESQRMIEEAEKQSAAIIRDAQKKADELIADAHKQAKDLSENTMKELSLASNQALSDIKQSVKEMLTKAAVTNKPAEAFNDDKFIADLISSIIGEWGSKCDINAAVQVPEDRKKAIADYISSSVKDSLDKNIEIEGADGIKNGFRIASENGRYYINFTDKEFDAFFREYIRPRVAEILFGEK